MLNQAGLPPPLAALQAEAWGQAPALPLRGVSQAKDTGACPKPGQSLHWPALHLRPSAGVRLLAAVEVAPMPPSQHDTQIFTHQNLPTSESMCLGGGNALRRWNCWRLWHHGLRQPLAHHGAQLLLDGCSSSQGSANSVAIAAKLQ